MKALKSIGLSLMVVAFLSSEVPAQRRRQNTPRVPPAAAPVTPAPTIDNFLAADSYRIYGEIRGVGQLLRSPSFSDIIDPIMKVAGPPKEFKTLMKWLNSEADALMTSRIVVASWPSRPKLPKVLFAIEFASPEEAQKFEPRLKTFLPKFLPTPTPESSSPQAAVNAHRNAGKPVDADAVENRDDKPKETLPPYIVKRSGALVYISDTAFNSKDLRPTDSKLLMEDPNFRRVHDRFSTESVLVYVDSGAIEREEQERRLQMEDEQQKAREAEAANPPKAEPYNAEEEMTNEELSQSSPPPVSEVTDPDVVPITSDHTEVKLVAGEAVPPESVPNLGMEALSMISRLFFGGRTIWPEAVGVAVAFEADAYAVRLLLVNEPGVKGNPIPFMPQLISGPSLTPESPSVFPGDTEFFVALSLDYPQIYEGMVKALSSEAMRPEMTVPVKGNPESPFAAYEKQSGIKIKDEIIPLLGNEIALSLPVQTLDVGPAKPPAEPASATPYESDTAKKPAAVKGPSPVIAVSVKDREGVRVLIPKLIESFGFKGAGLLAQTEKRGDTEITSYANALSYAFIGNFLLVSPDSKALRHVVDSYLNHDTLSSESHFRNYTRWQPRQVLGQFYVSPALMDSYSALAGTMGSTIGPLGEMLARLNFTSEPVTYALSNEGTGPLHELRLPKNLAMLMIAGIFGSSNQPSTSATNEAIAKGTLRTIISAEATYQATEGNGSYGTIDQLVAHGLMTKDVVEKNGYRIEVTVSGESFEARAMPLEYGKTGKLSFFVDETGVIRSGDKGGGPATVADSPDK